MENGSRGDFADAGGFELAEAIESGTAAAGVEGVAGGEGVAETCRAHGLNLSGPPIGRIVTKCAEF